MDRSASLSDVGIQDDSINPRYSYFPPMFPSLDTSVLVSGFVKGGLGDYSWT